MLIVIVNTIKGNWVKLYTAMKIRKCLILLFYVDFNWLISMFFRQITVWKSPLLCFYMSKGIRKYLELGSWLDDALKIPYYDDAIRIPD